MIWIFFLYLVIKEISYNVMFRELFTIDFSRSVRSLVMLRLNTLLLLFVSLSCFFMFLILLWNFVFFLVSFFSVFISWLLVIFFFGVFVEFEE